MKFSHVFSGAIAIALAATAITSAAATTPDASAYGYLTGKADRIEEAAPYAGMNYEGGEQGGTSTYGYPAGKAGRIEEAAPYAGMNYEGGEQGDTSGYSYQTGRFGKPWNTAE